MRITFQTKSDVIIAFSFGYNNELHSAMDWFTIEKIWINTDPYNGAIHVEYAKLLFSAFRHYKFWKKSLKPFRIHK